jgi:hypothetical protein
MPTLHVRSVPEDLYARVSQIAQAKSRSLSAQVLTMLYEALETEEQRLVTGQALSAIRRRRFTPSVAMPGSELLLREDRQR